jgi:hypothetical protein
LLSYGYEDRDARWLTLEWSTALERLLPVSTLTIQGPDGSFA